MAEHREIGDSELQALPRFQLAARGERLLRRVLLGCLLLVAGQLGMLWWSPLPGFQPVILLQVAGLLVFCAGVQSAWWVSRWRIRFVDLQASELVAIKGLERENSPGAFATATVLSPSGVSVSPFAHSRFNQLRLSYSRGRHKLLSAIRVSEHGLNSLGVFASSGLALGLVNHYWKLPAPDIQALFVGQIPVRFLVIVCLLGAAFIALVLERYFTHLFTKLRDFGESNGEPRLSKSINPLPEATQIAYLLRVYIIISLIACGALLLANETRQWPIQILVWLSALPAAIAVEFLVRTFLSLFSPLHGQEPGLLARSLLAELLAHELMRWPPKPFVHLQDELKQHFGIDLRQSWAFAYIRRSLLRVSGALVAVAWLYSGLVEIPVAERGIYERFGAPVAVWQPGIHLGLPWPFGRVQPMENGVIHEISAAALADKTVSKTADEKDNNIENGASGELDLLAGAEDAPPASANRLWDASHSAEKSQIIASEVITSEGKRQSFHIVNMDVRFMYRIGLSDSAALDARYTTADVPAIIRSTANRILVRYLATRTLEGVLGEARMQMAKEINTQLQADLDRLHTGVEIMSTVLEAIHPPAAAANAYHSVQAAQIKAQAIIARERGNAAQEVSLAQVRALIARNQASAFARETVATAEAANRRFSAERDAYQQGGKAFLLEHYFAQLTQGLASAQVLMVDHRLPNTQATLDLREFSGLDKSAKADISPVLAPTDFKELP